ncbi:RSVR protein, partial [Asarcornis scutulata]|nr:RSVR protein [Asarcornis scutulata]
PGLFRCEEPHGECFPREWICDGHPDCMDERDELGCEASESPAGPGAGGTGEEGLGRGGSRAPSEGCWPLWGYPGHGSGEWFSACALFSLVLLSCLVAVGGIVAWAQSKAKSRSDIFSLEEASTEEQLISDKSQ